MIPIPSGTQIWVACGATEMRLAASNLAVINADGNGAPGYCLPVEQPGC